MRKVLLWKACAATALTMTLSFFAISANADSDPPARVARLSHIRGPVTFAPAGSDEWAYASLNRPFTTGDSLWVDQGGRSELHIGSTAVRLGSQTNMSILALDDSGTQLKLTQGTLSVRVRSLFDDESFEIDTPNLAFVLQKPGEYRIDVDPERNNTTVTVRSGSGTAYGDDDSSYRIPGKERITFSGSALTQVEAMDAPPRDAFDRWLAERDRREDASRSARYVSREVTGYEELDEHGSWRQEPGYGAVWVPRVTVSNWAPYHYGHWVWIAPWGWTWVDDEPWGYAPFHYGRWAWIRSSWAWVPGPIVARPVYAPALVAFASGTSRGTNWNLSLSTGSSHIAWFPLAPGEVYRPAYTTTPTYVNNINRTVIVNKTVNVTNITNNITNNTAVTKTVYVNQQRPNAISALPATAFVKGEAVRTAAVKLRPDQLAKAPIASAPPVAPIKQSLIGKPALVKSPPPQRTLSRPVIATKPAVEPVALNDRLAQKLVAEHGTFPGAGSALAAKVRMEKHETSNIKVVGHSPIAKHPPLAPTNALSPSMNRPALDTKREKPLEANKPAALADHVGAQSASPSSKQMRADADHTNNVPRPPIRQTLVDRRPTAVPSVIPRSHESSVTASAAGSEKKNDQKSVTVPQPKVAAAENRRRDDVPRPSASQKETAKAATEHHASAVDRRASELPAPALRRQPPPPVNAAPVIDRHPQSRAPAEVQKPKHAAPPDIAQAQAPHPPARTSPPPAPKHANESPKNVPAPNANARTQKEEGKERRGHDKRAETHDQQ